MEPLGQHGEPTHVLAHLSDTHLGVGDEGVYGGLDPAPHVRAVMERLRAIRPDAIVVTGDVADRGEAEAYETVADIVGPVADEIGAPVVWVMGNHDLRTPFAARLLGVTSDGEQPLDQVVEVDGLRIVALDTTIPGYHDGALSDAQLEWLADVLSVPAEHGTVLAMHHPPVPSHLPLMALIELADQHRLAEVVQGTDVRTILAGHYHYSAHSLLSGIPVSVASSTCYVVDPGADPRGMRGTDGPWTFDLVHVHADRVVHSTVPVDAGPLVLDYPLESLAFVSAMTAAERREAFARIDADIDAIAITGGTTLKP